MGNRLPLRGPADWYQGPRAVLAWAGEVASVYQTQYPASLSKASVASFVVALLSPSHGAHVTVECARQSQAWSPSQAEFVPPAVHEDTQ
jgi:hypothetical protein